MGLGTLDEIIASRVDIAVQHLGSCVTFSAKLGMTLRATPSVTRSTPSVTPRARPADIRTVPSLRGADLVRFAICLLALALSTAALFAEEGLRIVPLVRDD